MAQHQEQLRVYCLAQGHFGTLTGQEPALSNHLDTGGGDDNLDEIF